MALPGMAPYAPMSEDLPVARADWTLDARRAALLVHDMQRYFCRPFGQGQHPLGTVVANIAALSTAARKAGIPVFYTAQKGNQFPADRGLQADLWGPGMQASAEHETILPELTPNGDDIVLVKHRYSAFQRSNLESLMRARGRDQLIVTGIYAHIGCMCTAAEAFQRDIQPFAIADAQADFDEARHRMAMDWIANCCGGVMSTQSAMAILEPSCS